MDNFSGVIHPGKNDHAMTWKRKPDTIECVVLHGVKEEVQLTTEWQV